MRKSAGLLQQKVETSIFLFEEVVAMAQGRLERQSNGRYAIYHEFTSGDVVEVEVNGKWVRSSIECSKDG
jgi:hypothetical protein